MGSTGARGQGLTPAESPGPGHPPPPALRLTFLFDKQSGRLALTAVLRPLPSPTFLGLSKEGGSDTTHTLGARASAAATQHRCGDSPGTVSPGDM